MMIRVTVICTGNHAWDLYLSCSQVRPLSARHHDPSPRADDSTRDSEVQIIESLSSFPGGHSFTVLAVTAEPCIILAAKKVTPAITERSCLTAVKLVKKSS